MGALHIEKASWTYVGHVEDGSRTTSLMADVNIKAIGVAESCLHSSHISCSRYLNTVSYHHLLLKPKLLVLQFVRSVRSSNKSLYLTSLIKTTYYFFALNHVHYARWTPVNIRDRIMLHEMHPGINCHFMENHFTISKASKHFSNICLATI